MDCVWIMNSQIFPISLCVYIFAWSVRLFVFKELLTFNIFKNENVHILTFNMTPCSLIGCFLYTGKNTTLRSANHDADSSRFYQNLVNINQTLHWQAINSPLVCSQNYTNGSSYVLATAAGSNCDTGAVTFNFWSVC